MSVCHCAAICQRRGRHWWSVTLTRTAARKPQPPTARPWRHPRKSHTQNVDVFAPAALGAVLNDATIPCLRCRIVCGGANNQLAEVRYDAALAARGIVFVPDYLANAGGVIDFHQETIDDQPDAVLASIARIGAITRDVLRCAAATGATPLSVADGIVGADPAGAR